MPPDIDLDKVFCLMGKKYSIPRLLLKAVAITESSLDPRAYRFEPNFWDLYLKNNPEWMDKNPQEVSASFGLCQLMFTSAWMLGYRGDGEGLYDPVVNVELGAKLLRRLYDAVISSGLPDKYPWLLPWAICLSRYNAGGGGNPTPTGVLKSQPYIDKVMGTWAELRKTEEECVAP